MKDKLNDLHSIVNDRKTERDICEKRCGTETVRRFFPTATHVLLQNPERLILDENWTS